MNKLFFYIILVFSALTFVSCNEKEEEYLTPDTPSENTTENTTPGQVTFTATLEDDGAASTASAPSRTTVTSGKVKWSAGDAISVLNSQNGFDTFTLSSGAGTASGTFTGSFTAGTTAANIAVYPAGNHSYDGTNLTVNLPATYGSADTEYSSNANVLMLAMKSADSNNLLFKHLGAGIRVVINVPVGATSVSLTGKGICGDFTIDPTATDAKITQSATDQTVTYRFKAFTTKKDATFYFPLPTGSYDKLVIAIASDAANVAPVTKTMNFGSAKSIERKAMISLKKITNIGFYEHVDLGLPSGTLWAVHNVGATNPADYGVYCEWGGGERTDPARYNWTNYKWGSSLTKYNATDNLTQLEDADDLACQRWGCGWHTPTGDQITELINNTTRVLTTQINSEGAEINGYLLTSTVDGYTDRSLFLPFAGYCSGGKLNNAGTNGAYWSSTLGSSSPSYAYYFSIKESGYNSFAKGQMFRYYGYSVRPVLKPASN